MSKRKSPARSTRPRTSAPVDLNDPRRLKGVARREAAMITEALKDAPPLDSEETAESFPFDAVASSASVAAVVERLVRRRIPGNVWNAVHDPMCKTDGSGQGYWAWTDAFRDAAFMVGVCYALRSMPDLPKCFADFHKLNADTRDGIERIIRYQVEGAR